MRRALAATAAATLLLAGTAAAAMAAEDGAGGPPDEVLDRAFGAAAEANRVATGLQKEKNPNSAAGLTRAEKLQRLADKHAGRERGNAGRVHAALLEGRSPSELAGLNAEAARAMAEANRALREAGDKPGRGLGRGGDGG